MKEHRVADYPKLWMWLLEGCPVADAFFDEDPDRPYSERLDCVEYAARRVLQMSESILAKIQAKKLLELAENARALDSACIKARAQNIPTDSVKQIAERWFWEIEEARQKMMEAFGIDVDWEQISRARRIREACAQGGHRSKRKRNPGILAALKQKLAEKPNATALAIWKSFPRLYNDAYEIEIPDQCGGTWTYQIWVDIPPGREGSFEITRLYWHLVDTDQRGNITFPTFKRKYWPYRR